MTYPEVCARLVEQLSVTALVGEDVEDVAARVMPQDGMGLGTADRVALWRIAEALERLANKNVLEDTLSEGLKLIRHAVLDVGSHMQVTRECLCKEVGENLAALRLAVVALAGKAGKSTSRKARKSTKKRSRKHG
jgi:hypothetical protein